MSSQEQSPTKKHCFTRGLMDQLKARAAIKRNHTHSSTLPIFIWESPPLARIYRITFLARLEPDGEEGLGFRFDDTVSETPRQIAWGGTVGTADSPRCFLDGSQTFLTESVAKASERCRRGWHVRVGKVSQIVQAFNNVEDSLVMKLSLRKLDSNTRVTNLVSQRPPPSDLEQSHQHNFQFSQPRIAAPAAPPIPSPPIVNPFASIRREVLLRSDTGSAKKKDILRPPTPPHTPPTTTNPITPDPPPTPSMPSCFASDAIISAENSAPPHDFHADTDNKAAPPPPPLRDGQPSPQSPRITSVPDPDTPSAPTNPVSPAPQKPVPEEIGLASTDTPPVVAPTAAATPESPLTSTQPPQSASKDLVCFVFPPTQRRLCARTIYIGYSHLLSIHHFKQALESPNNPLSIAEPLATQFPSTQTLRRTVLTLVRLVTRPVVEKLVEFRKLLAPRFPKLVYRIEDIVAKLVPAAFKVGLGLARVLMSACVAATSLVLDESVRFLESVVGGDSVDEQGKEDTHMSVLLCSAQRLVRSACAKWPALRFQLRLAETPADALVDDGDSDDELESIFGGDDTVEPPSPGELKATFTITQIAYPTFRGLSDYIQLGAVKFAPLRSTFQSQQTLACQLSEAGIMADLAKHFPVGRRAYIEARSVTVAKDEGVTGQTVSQMPCSPKSLYKLAEHLGMDELKELAQQQILRNLSPLNISHEIRLACKDRLVGLVQLYRETVTSTLGIER